MSDPLAVYLHGADRRHQIAVAAFTDGIFEALAGLKGGAEHAGVGPDRQGVGVILKP
jgi:hypothetical protein